MQKLEGYSLKTRWRFHCRKCKKKVYVYIFKRNNKKYMVCPKCLGESEFIKKKITVKEK